METMKNYNYDLATKIVEKFIELDVLENASMGIHEDWFWTAQTIWENNKWQTEFLSNEEADKMYEEFKHKRKNEGLRMFLDEKGENGLSKLNPEWEKYQICLLGGIRGSKWGTPVIQVELKDGTEKTFNCFIGENEADILEKITRSHEATSGCLSKPVQEHRSNIDIEEYKG